MDASDPPPLAVHRLRLLSDQPVEGCELVPDVFMLNGISPLSVRLEYKWYRCMDKMACSWCGKTPVVMQRLTDDTYFCSTQCFLNAWPGHQAQHRARACPCVRVSEPRPPGSAASPPTDRRPAQPGPNSAARSPLETKRAAALVLRRHWADRE